MGMESACNAGDTGDTHSIPGSGRSPGGGHEPMDRGASQATVQKITKTRTLLKQLSLHSYIYIYIYTPAYVCVCVAC